MPTSRPLNWNKPLERSTGEPASLYRELDGASSRVVSACDDWRDLTGDATVGVDKDTGQILGCEQEDLPFIRNVAEPAKPAVYLHLFHGRDAPDQEMDGWGFNGPTIGPLDYVHITYMQDIKFAADVETMRKHFPEVVKRAEEFTQRYPNSTMLNYSLDHSLSVVDDLVEHNGKFYGDFSISTEPPTGLYRIDVFSSADETPVHTEQFDGTALEAEQKLGEVWNRGGYAACEPGRFRAVLTDISGDSEYVWQQIDPQPDELLTITNDQEGVGGLSPYHEPREITMTRTPTNNLADALEDWAVHEPGIWENDQGPEGWWAVSNNDEAIVAYFAKPEDAYRWRLDMINRDLNP